MDRILTPEQRLKYELAYPLDAAPEQVETYYSGLSDTVSLSDALAISVHLPPLSRANFVAGYANLVRPSGTLLTALVDAHVAINPVDIYDLLKSVRQSAGLPAPSLLRVREALLELMTQHTTAVLTAHDLRLSANALLECASQIPVMNDPARTATLAHLLKTYRSLTIYRRRQLSDEFRAACQSLGKVVQHNSSADKIAQLGASFHLLVALSEPLALQQGAQDAAIAEAVNQTKDLLAKLNDRRDYRMGKSLLDAVLPALPKGSFAASDLANIGDVLDRLLIRDAIAALKAAINRTQDDPRTALDAFERLASNHALEQATDGLPHAFRHAVQLTKLTAFEDEPWILMRLCALHFGSTAPKVAVTLLTRLIDFGEIMSAPPAILTNLSADMAGLSHLSLDTDVPKIRPQRERKPVALVASALLLVGSSLLLWYQVATIPPTHQPAAPPDPRSSERELLPPVGRGQRLTREYVRYCHFQAERLRIIKQQVNTSDDVRAYNGLVNDYNSRCSDFFYQDDDLDAIRAEVSVSRAMLEADANRIISTWPWRSSSRTPQQPADK